MRPFLTLAILFAVTTAVVAQSDPIATRRNVMKGVGAATKTGGQIAKGEVPFELAKAQEVFKTLANAADTYGNYFPENSKTGGETTASPKIWETPDDFRARLVSWSKEIKTAEEQTKDLDTFKAGFGTVTKACGSCHQVYRVKT